MQHIITRVLPIFLLVAAACETTIRDDHLTDGGLAPSSGAGGSGNGASSSSSSGAGAADGAGGGADLPCPPADRLCPIAITYPLGSETSVELRGNFIPNGWSSGVPMKEIGGSWVATIAAPWAIDTQYKFVINGDTWIYDPANPKMIDDGYGGFNSLLKAQHCAAPICAPKPALRFAVIGDYGVDALSADGALNEAAVSGMVHSWDPELIITVGDNNYPVGAATTIDQNIGKYYHDFIFPYVGAYGPGADDENRFFPVLGNHDWYTAGALPYMDYFALPGNERYWEWGAGPVRFFGVDSDGSEIDGNTPESKQAMWLKGALLTASEPIRLVFMHHPPYSSGPHGSSPWMQWSYGGWGATAVIAGHDHTYERMTVDGLPYFVVGLGGASNYAFNKPIAGSQLRFTGGLGALLVEVPDGATSMIARMITTTGLMVDHVEIAP